MKAQATCFGAGTIVNAIATHRGAAFGLALRATAVAASVPKADGLRVQVIPGPAGGAACICAIVGSARTSVWKRVPQSSQRTNSPAWSIGMTGMMKKRWTQRQPDFRT